MNEPLGSQYITIRSDWLPSDNMDSFSCRTLDRGGPAHVGQARPSGVCHSGALPQEAGLQTINLEDTVRGEDISSAFGHRVNIVLFLPLEAPVVTSSSTSGSFL